MPSTEDTPAPGLSRKRRFLYTLVLGAIPLILLELGLRAVFAYHDGPSILLYGTHYYRNQMVGDMHLGTMNHRETYWKYYPHQKRYTRDKQSGKRIPVTINNHGFRGEDFSVAKPPNTIRVVTLGASSTFGFSDRDDETYPHYLQEILNERCGGSDRYEVLNLGIPHLKSDQILALFLIEGLALHPDVVTFYEGVNDSWDSRIRWKELKQSVPGFRIEARRLPLLHRAYVALRKHLLTVLLADQLLGKRDLHFTEAEVAAHTEGKSDVFVHNLEEIREACRQRGIVFIVASQQAKSFIVDRERIRGVTYAQEERLVRETLTRRHHITAHELYFLTHADLMRAEAAWAKADSVPYVDVVDVLDRRRDVLLSWVHVNAEGNRMIARALASAILSFVCPQAGT